MVHLEVLSALKKFMTRLGVEPTTFWACSAAPQQSMLQLLLL
jgi:hypothetical protein